LWKKFLSFSLLLIKFIISLSLNIKLNRSCFKLLYWRTLRTLNSKFFCLHRIFFPSLCTSKPHLKIIKKRTFEKVFFDYQSKNSNLIPIRRALAAESIIFDTFLLYLKFFRILGFFRFCKQTFLLISKLLTSNVSSHHISSTF